MGDFFLTYNEEGQAYFRRLIYLNILLYILMGIIFIVNLLDLITLVIIISTIAVASVIYALYFLYRNPPSEYDSELLSLGE
ncbi:MAG: hypothetical protein RTV72_11655 [Candidatus Thorarchaeota archaeon]